MATAASSGSPSGIGTTWMASATASSASPPQSSTAKTRVPGGSGLATSGADFHHRAGDLGPRREGQRRLALVLAGDDQLGGEADAGGLDPDAHRRPAAAAAAGCPSPPARRNSRQDSAGTACGPGSSGGRDRLRRCRSHRQGPGRRAGACRRLRGAARTRRVTPRTFRGRSVQRHARVAHEPSPAVVFAGAEQGEFLRRVGDRLGAEGGELLPHLRHGDGGGDRLLQPGDDGRRASAAAPRWRTRWRCRSRAPRPRPPSAGPDRRRPASPW